MTARTFATLDSNALGPALTLDLGNLVVTTNQDALDGSRAVFATIPKAVGTAFVEVYFYSTSRGDLTGLCSVGLAQVTAALDKYIGEEDLSWGFRPFDGGIWNDGAAVVTGDPIAERLCIGVYVNFNSPGGPRLTFYVEGSQYGSVQLPEDKFWVLAISLGAATAGDVSAFVNFGQRVFENQPAQSIT